MTTAPTLNPQVLGRAENAHRALLERILADTGITYHKWVALSLSAVDGGTDTDREGIIERMTAALKVDRLTAQAEIAELTAAQLLDAMPGESRIIVTERGKDLHRHVQSAIDETTSRLYSDIPVDDLATTGRVLSAVTARANAELARR